jgi:hypothetical protein
MVNLLIENESSNTQQIIQESSFHELGRAGVDGLTKDSLIKEILVAKNELEAYLMTSALLTLVNITGRPARAKGR